MTNDSPMLNGRLKPYSAKIHTFRYPFLSGSRICTDEKITRMEGKLSKEATVAKNATVQIEAGRKLKRRKDFYNLRFQSGTPSGNHGGRRYMPNVFTEQGVAMQSAEMQFKVNQHLVKMGLVWS